MCETAHSQAYVLFFPSSVYDVSCFIFACHSYIFHILHFNIYMLSCRLQTLPLARLTPPSKGDIYAIATARNSAMQTATIHASANHGALCPPPPIWNSGRPCTLSSISAPFLFYHYFTLNSCASSENAFIYHHPPPPLTLHLDVQLKQIFCELCGYVEVIVWKSNNCESFGWGSRELQPRFLAITSDCFFLCFFLY